MPQGAGGVTSAGEKSGSFLTNRPCLRVRVALLILSLHRCAVMEDEEISYISGSGEGLMDEAPATGSGAARRNEDIALDLMKFVAMTTGYGKTASSGGVGFTGGGAAAKPEDYAAHLLELYGKCLAAVGGKK
jgi:hypothetical protein